MTAYEMRISDWSSDVCSSDLDCIPEKAAVWEYWDRTEKRVRWVVEGIDEFLDDADPHLNLDDFLPCPRPAYGTLIRRTLIPQPDYKRYAVHQIGRAHV